MGSVAPMHRSETRGLTHAESGASAGWGGTHPGFKWRLYRRRSQGYPAPVLGTQGCAAAMAYPAHRWPRPYAIVARRAGMSALSGMAVLAHHFVSLFEHLVGQARGQRG
jgi:hypothetical protein